MKLKIKEWFEKYLDHADYMSLFTQLATTTLLREANTLTAAFNNFRWENTKEGYEYWNTRYIVALDFENMEIANGNTIPEPCVVSDDPFHKAKVYFPSSSKVHSEKPIDPKAWINFDKKIIGYKAPFDLFQGKIKKGEVFTDYSNHKIVMYSKAFTTRGVATEIVHTWEPVYGPNEITMAVGTPTIMVTIKNDSTIVAEGKQIPWGNIQKLNNDMNEKLGIFPWPSYYTDVKIGCSKFSRKDIREIWNTFAKLNNKSL